MRAALRPIEENYLQQLNGLMRSLTQATDLDGAIAVRDEIKTVQAAMQAEAPVAAAAPAFGDAGGASYSPGSGWYYVQSQATMLYLDVYFGKHDAGGRVDEAAKNPDQMWKFIPDGKGNYYIKSKLSELFLDSGDLNGGDEVQVKQTPGLVWKLVPAGKGNYFITSPATGLNLDVHGAYVQIGGKVGQAKQDSKQVWKLIKP